jgi:predicted DNA-binding protein (MmcQ/YjbR family)
MKDNYLGHGEVLEKLRDLCLSLPETSERASWGHPNFLAGKKAFVTFEHIRGRPSIAFRLDRLDIGHLIGDEQFFMPPYGRGQWISMWVDGAFEWDIVRDLVIRGYRLVALKRMIASLDLNAPL